MKKITLLYLFILFFFVGQAQLTDQEKKDLYPEVYTFEHAEKFEKENDFNKAIWIYVNLYPEHREKVIEKVGVILKKIDTLNARSIIVNAFSMYAMFDPTIVNWENGMPEINQEALQKRGSYGDALIEEFEPVDINNEPIIPLKTKNGFMVIFNFPKSKFTIRVEGEDVKPAEQYLVFLANNQALQMNIIDFSHLPNLDKCKSLKDSLLAHSKYELDYIEEMMKKKLEIKDKEMINIKGRKYLLWSYTIPDDVEAELKNQYFLVTRVGDKMFCLYTAAETDSKAKDIKKYFTPFAESIEYYPKEMDIQKIQETLKNE